MYRLHFRRNLRSLIFVIIAAAIPAAVFTLWWANRTGLPDTWRAAIERELGRQGLHMKIGALSYQPLRGVIASKVRVFADAERQHEVSKLERVLLDFDKTKLSRGIVQLNKIELRDAALSLPVDPDAPDAGRLEVTGAHGTLLMPGGRRYEIREARGMVAGIELTVNARITTRKGDGEAGASKDQTGKRRRLLARAIEEINHWRFDPAEPPQIRIFLEANTSHTEALASRITLNARNIEKNGHHLDSLSLEAEMSGDLLTVTQVRATDSRGTLEGRLDYDISDREGRFDVDTTLEIGPLLSAWFGVPPPHQLVIGGGQMLEAEGGFQIGEDHKPRLHMTGHACADSVMLRGVLFDSVESAFAWRDGELLLRDIRLSRPDGLATGKAHIQWPLVRLALQSTLPASVYKPFFAKQPLERVIDDFEAGENASFDIRLEGGFDATDRHSWAYSGGGTVTNVRYKGVPLESATCGFSLNHHELDFFNGQVVFNYRDYALRRDFNGPTKGTTKVGRIRYVGAEKLVEIEQVTGDVWAAPLVRLFAPKVADSLEIYRFHRPPSLIGNGVVDVTPRGRTRLDVAFQSADPADYRFLGENVTFGTPTGRVLIRGPRVLLRDLKLQAFDGPVAAKFTYQNGGQLDGEVTWTQLSIPGLGSTYGFKIKGGGQFTGRLEFSMTGGKVDTMTGEGLFALEKTELFSVPIFGPLSPLISGVLGDRRAGFERAKSAFCNFRIRDGIMRTGDFQTSTSSLTFVGDGELNLADRTMDMTLRMNARGLLGLITLPLRPFYGMFQFRGTGPLRDPEWENVMFTAPSEEQKQLLQAAPKATVVSDDN
jgi:hypothetical protein